MPRKTTGCWTCRIRKKKCDDGRPGCSSCTLRAITCYGYAARPQWMDGGDAEKAIMQDIKRQVKESYRRRRSRSSGARLFASQRDRHGSNTTTVTPSPSRALETLASSPYSLWPQENQGPANDGVGPSYLRPDTHWQSQDRFGGYLAVGAARTEAETPDTYAPPPDGSYCFDGTPRSDPGTRVSFDEKELDLVMYYLDHIFPRLAPYFVYSAADNGRGWLLNLFLRTKPLCSAAVCISACDKAQFVLGPLSRVPQPYHDLEMQHLRSMANLRDHLDQLSTKAGASQMAAGVEAFACIIHLIFFELWIPRRGLMNDWVMHLDAASALLSSLDAASPVSGGSPMSDMPEIPDAQCNIPTELLSESEKPAFEFLLGWYTYCFINATASLGLTPQSAQSIARTRALYHRGQSRLKDLLGCEDWVMLTLLDIAILKDWKQKNSTAGTLSFRELNRRAHIIEDRLHDGVLQFANPLPPSESLMEEGKRMVSNIYVNAALVFLHVVVSGFHPEIPEIQQSVWCTLQALEYMREHSAINFPSWPFCVAGCLALESQYPRFRALVSPIEKGKHPLVLSMWTLEILEECWKIRATQPAGEETCSWVTAMNQLGTRLLLL